MKSFRIHVFCVVLVCLQIIGCTKDKHVEEKGLVLKVVHGPELNDYMQVLSEQFLLRKPTIGDGTEIKVNLISEPNLEAAKTLASGSLKADCWIAPSSSHINYVNANLSNLGPKQGSCQQLFASPIVFVAHRDQKSLLVDSNGKFSWGEALQDEENKPTMPISLLQPDPLQSATGLAALHNLAYFASTVSGKALDVEGLNQETLTRLSQLEGLVAAYPIDETAMLEMLSRLDEHRIQVGITTERALAIFNANQGGRSPLVALYPEQGSFWQDYTYCVSEADWVDAAHQAALKEWFAFISSDIGQLAAKQSGFRPSIAQFAEMEPLTAKNGLDLSKPEKSLVPITGDAFAKVLTDWDTVRRPLASLLLLDVSGSMGTELEVSKAELRNWLALTSQRDQKALLTFASEVTVVNEFTGEASDVIHGLNTLRSLGGSAVFDGIRRAIDSLSAKGLDQYRKSLVLITDGGDKNSQTSLELLLDMIRQRSMTKKINFTIIAISRADTHYSDLRSIANEAKGVYREVAPAQLANAIQQELNSL